MSYAAYRQAARTLDALKGLRGQNALDAINQGTDALIDAQSQGKKLQGNPFSNPGTRSFENNLQMLALQSLAANSPTGLRDKAVFAGGFIKQSPEVLLLPGTVLGSGIAASMLLNARKNKAVEQELAEQQAAQMYMGSPWS